MKRRIAFFLITILTLAFALTGCKRTHEEIKDYEFAPKQETQADDPTDTDDQTDVNDDQSDDGKEVSDGTDTDDTGETDTTNPEDTTEGNSSDDQQPENEDPEITFTISNLCGVDIGMISILDPYTAEQMDVGMLRDGLSIVITLQWPLDNTVFDFAVYNVNGDLVSTSEVDISMLVSKHDLDAVLEYLNEIQ